MLNKSHLFTSIAIHFWYLKQRTRSLHDSRFLQTVGFVFIYLGFGLVVCYATGRPQLGTNGPRALRFAFKGLASLGVYSYTIYLMHAVVFMVPGVETVRQSALTVFESEFGTDLTIWLDRVLFWSVSIVLGVILSHVVDHPFLRLRSRIFSERKIDLNPQVAF